MPDLTPYIAAGMAGIEAAEITGKSGDAVKAGGYSAWINAVTGKPPKVVKIPGEKRARLVLDEQQIRNMQHWLDRQVGGLLAKKEGPPGSLEYELGPVFKPWAIKYALPLGAGLFLAGWVAAWYFTK